MLVADIGILERSAAAVLPPPLPPVSEWAEAHVRFDPGVDATTSYMLGKSPYAKPVMDWWLDPEVEEVFLIWPTQAGKTALIVVLICYIIANDPGPMIFVQVDEVPVKAFCRQRLKTTIEQTFPTLLTGGKSEWADEAGARLGGAHFWPAWSTSESRCRSWPRRYVFGDETSLWPINRQLVWERTKQFQRNRKGLWATTPTTENEQSWMAATEVFQLHRWRVPCARCGTFQALEFQNLVFDQFKREDSTWDLDAVEKGTRYRCNECHGMIEDSERVKIINAGEAHTEFPQRSGRRRSLRVTSLDVPNIPWGLTARAFLEAKTDPEQLRVVVNGWLTEPWRPREHGLSSKAIFKRVMAMDRGCVPENTEYLLASVDTQRGHAWVLVRAFLQDERSVLVAAAKVDGEGSTEKALEKVWDGYLSQTWRIEKTAETMGVFMSIIDSGDGATTGTVYRWAYAHYGRIWLAKGQSRKERVGGRYVAPWKAAVVDKLPDGRRIPGGLPLYHIRTSFYREAIIGAYSAAVDETGAWLISPEIPKWYANHLAAWQIERRRLSTGDIIREWRQVSEEDHCLDAECYVMALREILRFVPKQQQQAAQAAGRVEQVIGKPQVPAWAQRERF